VYRFFVFWLLGDRRVNGLLGVRLLFRFRGGFGLCCCGDIFRRRFGILGCLCVFGICRTSGLLVCLLLLFLEGCNLLQSDGRVVSVCFPSPSTRAEQTHSFLGRGQLLSLGTRLVVSHNGINSRRDGNGDGV
jgi:hypothetical protein